MNIAIVIPWRDSGERTRAANAKYVVDYYTNLDIGPVIVSSDGRQPGQPFNRHRAYNRAWADLGHGAKHDAVLWVEADTLIPEPQIRDGYQAALDAPGLVVPFTERHELDTVQTQAVFDGANPFGLRGATIYGDGRSIGQAGITSGETMRLIGDQWDEGFEGWGYDDNAMFHIFKALAGEPAWVEGKGVHLWHTPVFSKHTPESRRTTNANAGRFQMMQKMTPDQLREFLAV